MNLQVARSEKVLAAVARVLERDSFHEAALLIRRARLLAYLGRGRSTPASRLRRSWTWLEAKKTWVTLALCVAVLAGFLAFEAAEVPQPERKIDVASEAQAAVMLRAPQPKQEVKPSKSEGKPAPAPDSPPLPPGSPEPAAQGTEIDVVFQVSAREVCRERGLWLAAQVNGEWVVARTTASGLALERMLTSRAWIEEFGGDFFELGSDIHGMATGQLKNALQATSDWAFRKARQAAQAGKNFERLVGCVDPQMRARIEASKPGEGDRVSCVFLRDRAGRIQLDVEKRRRS